MAYSVQITPASASIKTGQSQLFTATLTDEPAGGTTSYVWTVNGSAQSSVAATMSYTPSAPGSFAIKVVSTTKVDEEPDVTAEHEVTLTVTNNVMTINVVASTTTPTIKLGENYTIKCDVTGAPAGATIAYKWNSGETTQSVTKASTAIGPIARKCTVTVNAATYDEAVKDSNEVTITVSESPIVEYDIYVHPLPWRASAYIWCGWWVMDAIEQLTDEGKDWKKATEADSKYYQHLQVLAQMIVEYPEVDVQESRNGRIVHKSALEAGIIY